MTVDFYFTKSTLMKLIKSLNQVPVQLGDEKKQLIKFGETLNNLDFQEILDLLDQADGKIDIDLDGFDLKKSIEKSVYKDILNESSPEENDDLYQLIFRVIDLDRDDIFRLFLQANENLLKIKEKESKKYPIELVVDKGKGKLFGVILELNNETIKYQMEKLYNRE